MQSEAQFLCYFLAFLSFKVQSVYVAMSLRDREGWVLVLDGLQERRERKLWLLILVTRVEEENG